MFIIKTLTFTQDGHQPGASGEFKNGPQWQTTAKGHSVSTLHLEPGGGITKQSSNPCEPAKTERITGH